MPYSCSLGRRVRNRRQDVGLSFDLERNGTRSIVSHAARVWPPSARGKTTGSQRSVAPVSRRLTRLKTNLTEGYCPRTCEFPSLKSFHLTMSVEKSPKENRRLFTSIRRSLFPKDQISVRYLDFPFVRGTGAGAERVGFDSLRGNPAFQSPMPSGL
jgi:hypothetical protein